MNPQVILPQEKTRQKKGLLQGLFLLEVVLGVAAATAAWQMANAPIVKSI